MLCWLTSGELDCVFLEKYNGNGMKTPTPAPPREAQMLCWLASGELECVFLEKYEGAGMKTRIPRGLRGGRYGIDLSRPP